MISTIRTLLLAAMTVVLIGKSMAQEGVHSIELIEYTNDSLGFKIDLPCDPEWQ